MSWGQWSTVSPWTLATGRSIHFPVDVNINERGHGLCLPAAGHDTKRGACRVFQTPCRRAWAWTLLFEGATDRGTQPELYPDGHFQRHHSHTRTGAHTHAQHARAPGRPTCLRCRSCPLRSRTRPQEKQYVARCLAPNLTYAVRSSDLITNYACRNEMY